MPNLHSSALGGLLLLASAGCKNEVIVGEAGACPHQVAGVCVGVPASAACNESHCPSSACSEVARVASDTELQAALTAATPGSCVSLAPGQYGDVTLPAGVSLFGRSADEVAVGAIRADAFDPAAPVSSIRGLRARGIAVTSAQLAITAVRVAGAEGDGIAITGGGAADILSSEVLSPGGVAVRVSDAQLVRLRRSYLAQSNGAALWAQCSAGCDCTNPGRVLIDHLLADESKLFGLVFLGVDAEAQFVDVLHTKVGDNFESGGAVSVAECADVSVGDLRIIESAFFGLMVDDSSAAFEGVEVSDTTLAVTFTRVGASRMDGAAKLSDADIHDNEGVGVCIGGSSKNVALFDTRVTNTTTASFPTPTGGVHSSGDGLQWTALAQARIIGLSLSGSERQSMLIDGPVAEGSYIEDIVLSGGDEKTGIVQQNVNPGSTEPASGGGTPAVAQQQGSVFDVVCP